MGCRDIVIRSFQGLAATATFGKEGALHYQAGRQSAKHGAPSGTAASRKQRGQAMQDRSQSVADFIAYS
jgi:hypothetical protein